MRAEEFRYAVGKKVKCVHSEEKALMRKMKSGEGNAVFNFPPHPNPLSTWALCSVVASHHSRGLILGPRGLKPTAAMDKVILLAVGLSTGETDWHPTDAEESRLWGLPPVPCPHSLPEGLYHI